MGDKKPFIDISGDNCVVEDCEFRGNRPTVKTSGKNTKLIRLKHIGQEIKDHPIRTLILAGTVSAIIAGTIILFFEYQFFV